MAKNKLSFDLLRKKNVKRCEQVFHKLDEWSPNDWVAAACGELGELANFLKKVRRGSLTMKEAKSDITKELADVVCYIDLLAARLDVDLGEAVISKFNEVSKKRNSSIFL